MASVREVVRDELRARVPRSWRIIDWQTEVDQLDSLTLVLSVSRMRRAAEAPMGAYDVTVTVTLVSPQSDNLRRAEGELEDALGELVPIIEDAFGMGWDEASKSLYAEKYLAWDIPVHYIASRSTTPTDAPASPPMSV